MFVGGSRESLRHHAVDMTAQGCTSTKPQRALTRQLLSKQMWTNRAGHSPALPRSVSGTRGQEFKSPQARHPIQPTSSMLESLGFRLT